MSFTYGQLKQAIQDYVEYDETGFVNNIPLFIRMAEERILKQVQLSLLLLVNSIWQYRQISWPRFRCR
jgi:hypothetical protein